ncbi:MAG: PorV/PorQ family protein [Melioribacteraceae bacterium]|nr:PorV/PorQ family protein [Melioribacteraceae bacterium]
MKIRYLFILVTSVLFSVQSINQAQMKKVAQSGMTYLAISLGARESAMGNASVASVHGTQSVFYNPATLTSLENFGVVINHVSWLADTQLYGLGAAYSFGQYGTLGLDMIYMDYGEIIGTQRVDKSVDERGFITTGDLNIQDYSIGVSYAFPINELFSVGLKLKYVHEYLGSTPIAVREIDAANQIYEYEDKEWKINNWGFDFGAFYKIGYKDLVLGVAFQNYSPDMKYWTEEFQMPLVLKMGLAMDIVKFWNEDGSDFELNTAIDLLHPIDYTERVHLGTELAFKKMFFFRAGYKFNYDVEDYSFGLGFNFSLGDFGATLDYAYTNAEFFGNVNRLSLNFTF